jgi:peptidoglycan LD-endopeptidase CwlK
MLRNVRSLHLGLLIVALFASGPPAGAQGQAGHRSRSSPNVVGNPQYGPGGVYARIPARDEFGRDQLGMFRAWNPDPIGNHEANLRATNPALARVVRKAQADNPNLPFIIGSGQRDDKQQRQAVAWGWSRTLDSPHRSGRAVDLWPLDPEGRVTFDPETQNRIAAALSKALHSVRPPRSWAC